MKTVFDELKAVLSRFEDRLVVQTDTPKDYALATKIPSPFKQHKGHPMFFGAVREGKAYVSFHLMPLYMCPPLEALISPALAKRMQGKSCFNFKSVPEPVLLEELTALTEASFQRWREQGWA